MNAAMNMWLASACRRRRRQRGAASVEFVIVAGFAFGLLLTAVLQLGLFMIAKNTVNLATFAAARAGAASGGDTGTMRQALAKALAPLYVGDGIRLLGHGGLTDVTTGNYVAVLGGAYASAYVKIMLPLDAMTKLNPRAAAFDDFSVKTADGSDREIPVTNLLSDTRIGAASQQRRADALLLKLEVRHCYPMVIPLINKAVANMMLLMPALSVGERSCYARPDTPGVPIVAQAVVRMTLPPRKGNFP